MDDRTISENLKKVYEQHEIAKESTIRKFQIVQNEGSRKVTREIEHNNLDAIISVVKVMRQICKQVYALKTQKLVHIKMICTKLVHMANVNSALLF